MTYEEMMTKARQEYALALWDAAVLRDYTKEAHKDSEVTAILEQVTAIQVTARRKLGEDTRAALATLGTTND